MNVEEAIKDVELVDFCRLPPKPRLNFQSHDKFLRSQKTKELYLGINTGLNFLEDYCPNGFYLKNEHFDPTLYKLGLYLGKLSFEKKQNFFVLNFTPTSLLNLKEDLNKINELWLDEENKNYTSSIKSEHPCFKSYQAKNLRTLCQKTKANIILSKEQALSYITKLHSLNTAQIQDFADKINKKQGLIAYTPSNEDYLKLLELKILNKEDFNWFKNEDFLPKNEATLRVLDYLSLNEKNTVIFNFDELFYAYVVWCLSEYTLYVHQGLLQDRLKMLFNPASYMKSRHYDEVEEKMKPYFNLLSKEVANFKDNIYLNLDNHQGFFSMNASSYLLSDEGGFFDKRFEELSFKSPNKEKPQPFKASVPPPMAMHKDYLWLGFNRAKLLPSIKGKIYFELYYDNKDTFVELLQRIYPDAIEGWSKNMLKKLEFTN